VDGERQRRVVRAIEEFGADSPPAKADPLALFREVVDTVPAYREFPRDKGVDPATITTEAGFRTLPLLDKDSYHRRYPLPELCPRGRLDGCDMIAVSSGSSGQPTIWPRFVTDELHIAQRFEQVFRDGFLADRPDLARELFGDSRLPTLVQYDPASRYFECQDGTLLFSGDNGIPLVRYHIADEGGVVPYERMLEFCSRNGFTPPVPTPELPFVYVFGPDLLARSIRDQLLRLNSEFAHYVPEDRQLPEVVLRPAGDPEYFPG
jgi:phenylacetate-coenzyme A ligase PaaK-like adenylate-forming protein